MAATHSQFGSSARRFFAALLLLFALQPLLHAHAAGAPASADPAGLHLPSLADTLALDVPHVPLPPQIVEVGDGVRVNLLLAGPRGGALVLPEASFVALRPYVVDRIAPRAGASPLAPSPRDPPLR